jgi:uncharacterized membrane protein
MLAYVFSLGSGTRLDWRERFCHLTHAILIQPYPLVIISGAGGATTYVSQRERLLILVLRPISILNSVHQIQVLEVYKLLLADLLLLLPA